MSPEKQRQTLIQRQLQDRRANAETAIRAGDRRRLMDRRVSNLRVNHWLERYHAHAATLAQSN